MNQITDEEMKVLIRSQQGELDAVLMYKALARCVRDVKDKAVFHQLAKEEAGHAAVFYKLTNTVLNPGKTKAILLPILYRIAGKKFLYPLIARGEYAAYEKYEPVRRRFKEVETVRNDEKRHGDMVMKLLERS